MAVHSSTRLLIAMAFEVSLFALAAFTIATLPDTGAPITPRITLAFAIMGLGLAAGWYGAIWARAARPFVERPPGLDEAFHGFKVRSRFLFALVFGISVAIAAPFAPSLSSLPVFASVAIGGVVGAFAGLILGQVFAVQTWNSRMPNFLATTASNKSLERTRDR